MAAGIEREALLRFADQLCAGLGYARDHGETAVAQDFAGGEREGMVGMLSPEDERLVNRVRWGLAKLAAAVGAEVPTTEVSEDAVRVALDGAELMMRGELIRGSGTQLGALMPSFVFLITLPIVAQDEALDLSRRTSELIEQELGR